MRRTRLVCAIVMGLSATAAAGSQATEAGALSAALRSHLQDERFQIVTSVRGLPLGVRDGLQMLFGGGVLDIADSGAEFQAGPVAANSKLPTRRLVAAGCSIDFHCLVYYQRGGSERTWHIALFHWSPASTRFEGGGIAPSGLATIDEIRTAILGGWNKPRFW